LGLDRRRFHGACVPPRMGDWPPNIAKAGRVFGI
jgi:hypothetical protein